MLEKIGVMLNSELGGKKPEMKEMQEVKKIIVGEVPQETRGFSESILRTINNYIENDKANFILSQKEKQEKEIEDARALQMKADDDIRDRDLQNMRSSFMKILDKNIEEASKISSEDSTKILQFLGKIKQEMERI
jgi:hypothetical protein